jgi:uncharacterized HAD superfamily protein
VALRIGIDLDGVLADMNAALDQHADQLFGPAPSAPDPARDVDAQASVAPEAVSGKTPLRLRRRLTERQQRRLWRRIRGIDGFWERLEETEPGVVARLSALATERRWEIIFLTKRPTTAGATSQIQSQRWLASKGFPLPSVFVVTGSRGLIATALALDIVVDDRPENCVDVAIDSPARTIAIFRETQPPPPTFLKTMGIDLVRSAAECLDLLLEIDENTRRRPGLIERLMRKAGLREGKA